MKWSLERKLIVGGFSFAFLLTSFSSIISYQNSTQLIESGKKVQEKYQLLNTITDIFNVLIEAESGRRGYLISEDQEELKRYQESMENLPPKLRQLRSFIAKNSDEKQLLTNLELLIAQRLSLAQESIILYQKTPQKQSIQAHLFSQIQKNRYQIQNIIIQLQNIEEQKLQKWVKQSQKTIRYRLAIELLSSFMSLFIILGLFLLLYRQLFKRQEAEIRQYTLAKEKDLSELKIRFFSMVSHEFRTPLSIILGSAQLLSRSSHKWTEEKKLKNLNRIQSSARLMTNLLTDILILTRAEAGKLEYHPTLIDLEFFCLNLIADFQLIDQSEHLIEFSSLGRCTHAQLDEKHLHSILSNLLSNAIKYSPSGTTINFTLNCESNLVIFQIQDQGIGIPQDSLSHLYEPFYRAANFGNTSGTGLGLAVVKKCVDIHSGEIFLDSQVNLGTTFTIKIPQFK